MDAVVEALSREYVSLFRFNRSVRRLPEKFGAAPAPHPTQLPAGGEDKGEGVPVLMLRLISGMPR